jgi:hypothetical protein
VVDDATAGRHPLGVSGVEHTGSAGASEGLKRAVQHKCDGFDSAMRMRRESVSGHPILGHKQKWVAESRIFSADGAAGSMPRDTAGLELWVRNQSDFAGFRWCYGKHGKGSKHWPSLEKAAKFIPS